MRRLWPPPPNQKDPRGTTAGSPGSLSAPPVHPCTPTRGRPAGATGKPRGDRDGDAPNVGPLRMEWDTAENAKKVMDGPALRGVMQKAGVIGAPAVRAVLSAA